MIGLDNLTAEQEKAIHDLLIPIGHKEEDKLHRGRIVDGKFIEDEVSLREYSKENK